LEVEEGIGAVAGGAGDYGVELLKVILGGGGAAAVERPVLVDRNAENIRGPVLGPVGDFGSRDQGPVLRFCVFETGAVNASQEDGTPNGIS
jgi:hypothetical protein